MTRCYNFVFLSTVVSCSFPAGIQVIRTRTQDVSQTTSVTLSDSVFPWFGYPPINIINKDILNYFLYSLLPLDVLFWKNLSSILLRYIVKNNTENSCRLRLLYTTVLHNTNNNVNILLGFFWHAILAKFKSQFITQTNRGSKILTLKSHWKITVAKKKKEEIGNALYL